MGNQNTMKIGEWVQATVFATAVYGIHLRTPEGTEVFVHSYDMEWTDEISPTGFALPGTSST